MKNGPAAVEAAPEKRIKMKLERHCNPSGMDFEIIGHFQPELRRKNPAGVMEVVRAEAFIPGEPAPPPLPGVGTKGKLWAGTIIALPESNAKALRRAGIASVEILD